MKRTYLTLWLLLLTATVYSQGTQVSGSPVYYSGNSVNIGGNTNGSLYTRHLYGKETSSTLADHLYLNYNTGKNVWVGSFTSNPSNLLVDGKIGVGTASPGYKLEVNGNMLVRSEFSLVDGRTNFLTGSSRSAIYTTLSGSGGFPFNLNGNLVIQSRSSANRDIAFVTGTTPETRMVVDHSGNVGIGTANPGTSLDINNGTLRVSGTSNLSQETARFVVDTGASSGHTLMVMRNNNGEVMRVEGSGKVGIGTNNPGTSLDINNGTLRVSGTSNLGQETARFVVDTGASSGHTLMVMRNNNGEVIRVEGTGNVGIGTTSPNEKLEVAGNALIDGDVYAQKIEVSTTPGNWPDYVFESDYKTLSLSETEAFIKKNKHLPEVPSAKEVEANGQDLGHVQTILLKKIEEMTLQMIEMNKALEKSQQLIKAQDQRIKALERKKD